jgi:SAM-dependent methyltransferase
MANAWLTIPLKDYEQHMNSAAVQQLGVLSELFLHTLDYCRPESVAVLGIAGGNGLEQINPAMTRRVCGIDLNPDYLEAARQRFRNLPGLELLCVDLAEQEVEMAPVQLAHAALIFEHAGMERCLDNALNMVAAGGRLSVVLQLPSCSREENISVTSPVSIQKLRPHFRLIEPAQFVECVEGRGFHIEREAQKPLPSGKGFWVGVFRRTIYSV